MNIERDGNRRIWRKLAPWLLVMVVIVVYANSLGGAFVYDDQRIIENPDIRTLRPPWRPLCNSTRPIPRMTHAVNYAIHGEKVFGYHAVNIAVHILAALCLFGVARFAINRSRNEAVRKESSILALAIAMIWAVHPLQTESVTYIVQRSEAMAGLFCLLSMYCLTRSTGGCNERGWLAGSVASCGMAMLSKPVAVVIPFIVLSYDYSFISGSVRGAFRRRGSYYGWLAMTWLPLVLLLFLPNESTSSTGSAVQSVTYVEYVGSQPGVLLQYLKLFFWPRNLCLDYAWLAAVGWREITGPLSVISCLLIASITAIRRHRSLGFAGISFFVLLAPTSIFVSIADIAVEHRVYLASACLCAVTVMLLHAMVNKTVSGMRGRRLLLRSLLITFVVLLGWRTMLRNRDYGSALVMWRDVVAKRPSNAYAQTNLGKELMMRGNLEEAIRRFEIALSIKPKLAEAILNKGVVYSKMGEEELALKFYRKSICVNPGLFEGHYNLAAMMRAQGNAAEAIMHYRDAVRIRPRSFEANYDLGAILASLGRMREAVDYFIAAAELNPDCTVAHQTLGNALFDSGRYPESVEAYDRALELKPGSLEVENARERAAAKLDRP